MRILMVTEDIPAAQVGGLGKHVIALSNALIDAGHEVVLLGRADIDYSANEAEIGFRGRFISGFQMNRNGWKEAQLGVWMPYKRLALARRIEKSIAQHSVGFDVVHYHGHLATVGLGLPVKVPFLQTRHDQGAECITHLRFRNGAPCQLTDARKCAGCATSSPNWIQTEVSAYAVSQYRQAVAKNVGLRKTLFVSNFLLAQFRRAMPDADVTAAEVVHNFVELDKINGSSIGAESVVKGTVLLVGRIDEAKGFRQFLEAWSKAGQAQARVIVIGDGAMRQQLETQFGSFVEFKGWLLNDLVVQYLRSAHVCVVPSVWEEPFGLTTLEALALGRPCVALNRGGTPELADYTRYGGQLGLVNTMDELVSLTNRMLAEPVLELPLTDDYAADIRKVLPRMVSIYRNVNGAARRSGWA